MSLSPHSVRGIRFGVRLGQDVVVGITQLKLMKYLLFPVYHVLCI